MWCCVTQKEGWEYRQLNFCEILEVPDLSIIYTKKNITIMFSSLTRLDQDFGFAHPTNNHSNSTPFLCLHVVFFKNSLMPQICLSHRVTN